MKQRRDISDRSVEELEAFVVPTPVPMDPPGGGGIIAFLLRWILY